MQTFLPYPNMALSLHVLDNRRLGKQRVETMQILRALTGLTDGWVNHPATRMWRGYEHALGYYLSLNITEWRRRGFMNTIDVPYVDGQPQWIPWIHPEFRFAPLQQIQLPPWLGDEQVHSSHRGNLLRKDAEWYGQFGWDDPVQEGYYWPVS